MEQMAPPPLEQSLAVQQAMAHAQSLLTQAAPLQGSNLVSLPIKELKALVNQAGLTAADCTDKAELIQRAEEAQQKLAVASTETVAGAIVPATPAHCKPALCRVRQSTRFQRLEDNGGSKVSSLDLSASIELPLSVTGKAQPNLEPVDAKITTASSTKANGRATGVQAGWRIWLQTNAAFAGLVLLVMILVPLLCGIAARSLVVRPQTFTFTTSASPPTSPTRHNSRPHSSKSHQQSPTASSKQSTLLALQHTHRESPVPPPPLPPRQLFPHSLTACPPSARSPPTSHLSSDSGKCRGAGCLQTRSHALQMSPQIPPPSPPPFYPPPSPLPPPLQITALPGPSVGADFVRDRLNARFTSGMPSSDPEQAGVLIHTFDGHLDAERPWELTTGGWHDGYAHVLSASLVNSRKSGAQLTS
jgi:hypothetical protein